MKTSGSHLADQLQFLHPRIYGQSVKGRNLTLYSRGEIEGATLLVGGLHGDERASVMLLESFLLHLSALPPEKERGLLVIPVANPDSYIRNSRYNANGVDLNRNFPYRWNAASEEPAGPHPLSEPESKSLASLIATLRPRSIVALHWALAEIDADGPQSTPLARAMWKALTPEERRPYRLRTWDDIPPMDREQPLPPYCPGSLGQWAGHFLKYEDGSAPAMVTLELPYDPALPRPEVLPDDHLDRLQNDWSEIAVNYLREAEPAVRKMLEAACRFG